MNTQNQPAAQPDVAHTPGPWTITFEDENCCYIDTVSPSDPQWAIAVPQGPNALANAAFIVRACNAYEQDQRTIARLREALTGLVNAADEMRMSGSVRDEFNFGCAHESARAVLAETAKEDKP